MRLVKQLHLLANNLELGLFQIDTIFFQHYYSIQKKPLKTRESHFLFLMLSFYLMTISVHLGIKHVIRIFL